MSETARFILYESIYVYILIAALYLVLGRLTGKLCLLANKKLSIEKIVNNIVFPTVAIAIIMGIAIKAVTIVMGTIKKYPENVGQWSQLIIVVCIVMWGLFICNAYLCHNNWLKFFANFIVYFRYLAILGLVAVNVLEKTYLGYNVLLICCISLLTLLMKIYGVHQYAEDDNDKGFADKPCESYLDLYPTRKKEINSILNILDEVPNDEPFAIMVKGSWGIGKTSFINGLQSRVLMDEKRNKKPVAQNGYRSIKISAGFSQKAEEIIAEIEKQLIEILSEDYYLGKSKEINEYFNIMSSFASIAGIEQTNTVLGMLPKEESSKLKASERMNQLLKGYNVRTGNRILIIIDDLERCPSKNLKNVFLVLMETTRLSSCITMVICDYAHLIGDKNIDKDFLDKYFGRSFALSYIDYSEMLENHGLSEQVLSNEENPLEDNNINSTDKYMDYLETVRDSFANLVEDAEKLLENVDLGIKGYTGLPVRIKAAAFKEFVKNERYLQRFNNSRNFFRMCNIGIRSKVKSISLFLMYDKKYFDKYGELDWYKIIIASEILEYIIPELYDYYETTNESFLKLQGALDSMEEQEISFRKDVFRLTILSDLNYNEISVLDWIMFGLRKSQYISDDLESVIEEWYTNQMTMEHLIEYIHLFGDTCANLVVLASFILENYKNDKIIELDTFQLLKIKYNGYLNNHTETSAALVSVMIDTEKCYANERRKNKLNYNSVNYLYIVSNSVEACFTSIEESVLALDWMVRKLGILDESQKKISEELRKAFSSLEEQYKNTLSESIQFDKNPYVFWGKAYEFIKEKMNIYEEYNKALKKDLLREADFLDEVNKFEQEITEAIYVLRDIIIYCKGEFGEKQVSSKENLEDSKTENIDDLPAIEKYKRIKKETNEPDCKLLIDLMKAEERETQQSS